LLVFLAFIPVVGTAFAILEAVGLRNSSVGPAIAIAYGCLYLGSGIRMLSVPCPRCGELFFWKFFALHAGFRKRCLHCDLLVEEQDVPLGRVMHVALAVVLLLAGFGFGGFTLMFAYLFTQSPDHAELLAVSALIAALGVGSIFLARKSWREGRRSAQNEARTPPN
jgi:hypothetical protein